MKIIIKYTLHSDQPPPEPALDLHQHELTIADLRVFMFNIYAEEAAPPLPDEDTKPTLETYIVIADYVNIRTTPSTSLPAIGKYYKDNIIYVEEVLVEGANTWAKHTYMGETAYSAIYYQGITYLKKV